jgi:hypothetical protein
MCAAVAMQRSRDGLVSWQRLGIHVPVATITHATEKRVLSTQSALRSYKKKRIVLTSSAELCKGGAIIELSIES